MNHSVVKIDQVYEEFTVELIDLKLSIQEKSVSKSMRLIRVLNPKCDLSVHMLCLLRVLTILDCELKPSV